MNSFSGIKDIDREILLAMDDKSLLKTCSLNKYLFNIVCDDNFFYKRLLLKYPDTLVYYKKNENFLHTYKSYYLKIIYYISKMQEDYNYSYISGNPKVQYKIFQYAKNNINRLLFQSSIKGELNLVKEAIHRGANIHANNEEALRWASRNGHLETVKYLVENGADIHANDESTLHYASYYGYLEVVKYLVENGADIHINNEEALRYASENGKLDVVKYLVNLGADIHVNNDEALIWASESKHLEMVKYLNSL